MMPVSKRFLSELENPYMQPNKSPGLSSPTDIEQSMALAISEIQELKNHVAELYEFIERNGLALSSYLHNIYSLREANVLVAETPPLLEKRMDTRQGAAQTLATQIKRVMSEAHTSLYDETCDARKTGVTSDDLSEAMMPFFSDIERLRDLPGSTVLAYDLAKALGNYSYGELEMGGSGYGD